VTAGGSPGYVLVAGASGFVGGAVARRFVADGWRVLGAARRPPLMPMPGADFVSVDLLDRDACAATARGLGAVTHLAFAAVNETAGEIGGGWAGADYIDRNSRMFANLLDPLIERGGALRQVIVVHGTKAYAPFRDGHLPVPLKESMARPANDDAYFRQEDHLRAATAARPIGWTVFRPQIIAGGGMGSNLNVLLALAVFASIRKALGQDLPIVGLGPYAICEMTDVELLAEAVAWSADRPTAQNETFNVTNGDVFCWPDLLPVIADEIGVPIGAPAEISLRAEIAAHAEVWGALVRAHRLPVPAEPDAFLGGSATLADFALRADRNVVTSTIKLRQAGFGACIDTGACAVKWIRRWREMGMLPLR
jgi:nucleoside-diphosphate-sugar epimerase